MSGKDAPEEPSGAALKCLDHVGGRDGGDLGGVVDASLEKVETLRVVADLRAGEGRALLRSPGLWPICAQARASASERVDGHRWHSTAPEDR